MTNIFVSAVFSEVLLTLAFVVNDTGSMGGENSSVQRLFVSLSKLNVLNHLPWLHLDNIQ